MDFADNLTSEDMKAWNKSITADASGEKMVIGVYYLLVMAVGCIGMLHDDFCKCIFGEFESICKVWRRKPRSWERARTIATILIQPHVKKRNKATPRQLLPMPWVKEREHQSSKPLNLTPRSRSQGLRNWIKISVNLRLHAQSQL